MNTLFCRIWITQKYFRIVLHDSKGCAQLMRVIYEKYSLRFEPTLDRPQCIPGKNITRPRRSDENEKINEEYFILNCRECVLYKVVVELDASKIVITCIGEITHKALKK